MVPFFSVIIPTLNEEHFLPDLLDCLKKQIYRNFEVIIVDGSSDDYTAKRARAFQKYFSQLSIRVVKKRNVGYQRNVGAKIAKGKYLVFLDADVRIHSDFLSSIASEIVATQSQLLTTYITSPDRDIRKMAITNIVNIGKEIVTFMGHPTAGGYNIIVNKKLFLQMKGFDIAMLHGEDYDLIERLFKRGVTLRIIRNPAMIFSFRRFENEGYISTLEKEAASSLYALFGGFLHKPQFEYRMGGHLYPDKSTKGEQI
jgi:glycosyltransferase involved in cell wall biosynthesis